MPNPPFLGFGMPQQMPMGMQGNLGGYPPQQPMTQTTAQLQQPMMQMPMGMQNAFSQFQQNQRSLNSLQPQSAPSMGAPQGMQGNLGGYPPQQPMTQTTAQQQLGGYPPMPTMAQAMAQQPMMQMPMGLAQLPPSMPQAPMMQQTRQEDPRMMAMRNMQRVGGMFK